MAVKLAEFAAVVQEVTATEETPAAEGLMALHMGQCQVGRSAQHRRFLRL